MKQAASLSMGTGIGLVVANMIGSGVLTTAGFLADTLTPSLILLAWAAGGVIAMAGARAYAALAEQVPRSGGEYRYLHVLMSPSLGYLAGWTSLLLGFSAPIAMAALAAGAFGDLLFPVDSRAFGIALIAIVTVVHALHLRTSSMAQNGLVAIKIILLFGFVLAGVTLGSHVMPTWPKPVAHGPGGAVGAFCVALVYIGFCYSGWNAASYISEEFRSPKRDVPRAMMIGCLLVAAIYLLINWVFVANLSQEALAQVKTDGDRITLGHSVMRALAGEGGAKAMTILVLVALTSSMSAMTLVGPRVYAAMAQDGLLPKILIGKDNEPPFAAVLLQSGVAVALVLTHRFSVLLQNAGCVLTLVSMLAVASLFRRGAPPLTVGVRLSAAVYLVASAWALIFSILDTPSSLVWIAVIAAVSWAGFTWTSRYNRPMSAGVAAVRDVQLTTAPGHDVA